MDNETDIDVTIHNADKKIAQLVKVISNISSTLEDIKYQKTILNDYVDGKLMRLGTDFSTKTTKVFSDIHDTSNNITEQYEKKFTNLYQNAIYAFNEVSTLSRKKLDATQKKVQDEVPKLLALIKSAVDAINIIHSEGSFANDSLNAVTPEKLKELQKKHELDLKKFDLESDKKYENFEKSSKESLKILEEQYKTKIENEKKEVKIKAPPTFDLRLDKARNTLLQMKTDIVDKENTAKQITLSFEKQQTNLKRKLSDMSDGLNDMGSGSKEQYYQLKEEIDQIIFRDEKELASLKNRQISEKATMAKVEYDLNEDLAVQMHKTKELNQKLQQEKNIHEQKKEDLLRLFQVGFPDEIKKLSNSHEEEKKSKEEKIAQIEIDITDLEKQLAKEKIEQKEDFEKLSRELSESRQKEVDEHNNTIDTEKKAFQKSKDSLIELLSEKNKDDEEYQKAIQEKERLTNSLERIIADHAMTMRSTCLIIEADKKARKENHERVVKEEREKFDREFEETGKHHASALARYPGELQEAFDQYVRKIEHSHRRELRQLKKELEGKSQHDRNFDEASLQREYEQLVAIYNSIDVPEVTQMEIDLSPLKRRVEEAKQSVEEERESLRKTADGLTAAENTRHQLVLSHGQNAASRTKDVMKKLKMKGAKDIMALKLRISALEEELDGLRISKTSRRIEAEMNDDELGSLRLKKENLEVAGEREISALEVMFELQMKAIRDDITKTRRESMDALARANAENDKDFEVIRHHFKDELARRAEIKQRGEANAEQLAGICFGRYEKAAEEMRELVKARAVELEKARQEAAEVLKAQAKELAERRSAMERRMNTAESAGRADIEALKRKLSKALDDISVAVDQASANLENGRGRVKRRPPRREEAVIIDNLEARLEEVTEELAKNGRVMLQFQESLLERDPKYTMRFENAPDLRLSTAVSRLRNPIPKRPTRLSATLPLKHLPALA